MNKDAVDFLLWVNFMDEPKYSGDIRRRFTPQVELPGHEQTWIDTFNFDPNNPVFYTASELYNKFILEK
jgi:hypothetical protein